MVTGNALENNCETIPEPEATDSQKIEAIKQVLMSNNHLSTIVALICAVIMHKR
jgi:hypothetical protein